MAGSPTMRLSLRGIGLVTAPLRVAAASTRIAVTAAVTVTAAVETTALLTGNVASKLGKTLAPPAPTLAVWPAPRRA